MTTFKGLPKDFFAFFKELAKHNERAWFEANKQRYKDVVVAPLSDFMAAMAPRVAKISKHIVVDPRPNGGSMFRIYRDVRFGKDKRPYKENAGCQFRHALGKDAHAPGFYMHFAVDEVFFGGGVWMPEPDALNNIRHAIADDAKAWKKIVERQSLRQVVRRRRAATRSRARPRASTPITPASTTSSARASLPCTKVRSRSRNRPRCSTRSKPPSKPPNR